MAVISELLRSEEDGTISFGDYTLSTKAKLDNFEELWRKLSLLLFIVRR